MLTPDEVVSATRALWRRHQNELSDHERVYRYSRGLAGVPEVPEGANDELKTIARQSVLNVLDMIVNAFSAPMSVEGYRSAGAEDNAEVWRLWQADRMDARQTEIYRPTVTYGSAYTVALKDSTRIRSPRQMLAVYADPHIDLWPIYALEHWIDYSAEKSARKGIVYFEGVAYPVNLGNAGIRYVRVDGEMVGREAVRVTYDEDDAFEHGAAAPPVIRYVNDRDAEDLVVGEVHPLILDQQALSAANFDRLVVSRFGAFPQKYVIGWAPDTSSELQKTSVRRLMAFEDDDVKAGAFPAAQIQPYNELINDMRIHIAKKAQAPIGAVMNKAENVGADTVAALDAPYQRKLDAKRRSWGESHEQYLRLKAELNGIDVPDDAEVIWDTTEARSFAQVVDGISKLAAADASLLPELLEDIPGWNQQRVDAARSALRRSAGSSSLNSILDRITASPAVVADPRGPVAPNADAG